MGPLILMIACPQCLAAGIAASINGPTCFLHPGQRATHGFQRTGTRGALRLVSST